MNNFFSNRSIRLRSVNIRFLFIIGVLCISLIVSTIQLVNQFISYKKTVDLYAEISKIALELQEASDYLTEEARFFVLSGDYNHLENYFYERNENRRREKSIALLSDLDSESSVVEYLNLALAESHSLEVKEFYSMALIIRANHLDEKKDIVIPEEIRNIKIKPEDEKISDQYKTAKAWLLMFSEDYMAQKHRISQYKNNAISQIFNYTEDTHKSNYEHLKDLFFRMILIISLVFIFNLLLFICIIVLVIIPLKNNINNIKDGSRLDKSNTHEFNILTNTYNEMFDKNETNEILLRHKAEHDDLTGLINRRAYQQILEALLTTGKNIALIIIDVDFFKLINDNYGHPIGDKILQKVGSSLTENFRASDYIARIGGDEFTVIVTDCDTDRSKAEALIAGKLDSIFRQLSDTQDGLPAITLSCGIEFTNNGNSTIIYEHADSALYEAKRAGRKGYRFFSDNMDELISTAKEI